MSECRNCDVHRFIACKNGLLPGGCHKSEISGLYSAEPGHDSLASRGELIGGVRKHAGTPYDDALEKVRDLQKKLQDLRDQEDIDELKAIVEAGDEYFKLEAEVNQYLNLKSAIAKLKEQLKPRSPGQEFIEAAQSAGAERPFLAQVLEKQFEIYNDFYG